MSELDIRKVARVEPSRAVQITEDNIRDVLALLESLRSYNWRKIDYSIYTPTKYGSYVGVPRIRWWEGDYACFANVGEWIVIDEDNEWIAEWNPVFVEGYAEVFDI